MSKNYGCECDESRLHTLSHSGFCWLSHENKGRVTIPKTDDFLEKIQTAFNPLPLFFEKSCCNFFKLHAQKALFKDPKSATSIFRTFLKTYPFRCRHPSLNIMLKDHVNSMVWHYMYNDCKVEIDTARGVLDASSGITRYWFVSKWKNPKMNILALLDYLNIGITGWVWGTIVLLDCRTMNHFTTASPVTMTTTQFRWERNDSTDDEEA